MRATFYRQIILSSYELWCIALAAGALLVAGNAKLLLQHYDLISSSTVVGQQLSNRVTGGLDVLDSFSVTPGLVTFIAWGVIGLVVFSIAQAFARASATVRYERELGSNQYVHPENFDRQRYWKHVLTSAAVSFGLITLLAIAGALYLLFVVPVSFFYLQTFLLHVSLGNVPDAGLGMFAAFAGTAGLYVLGKLTVWHHRLSHR